MKKILLICFLSILLNSASAQQPVQAPAFAIGNFTDDYQITYSINDTLWIQYPNTKYRILKWNLEKQFLIAQNDAGNKTDRHKYTRIDFMSFTGMAPYTWGFCLTAYDADTPEMAEKKAIADRSNPKKGCNGYPFSRMKKTVTQATNEK
ncbi:MAG: hypothetical protein REI78_02400 [Pedobacter sp.]|nr:hypothetical protein [Pedobacter sp.]MDQ8051843.1 hypothetical protein [Pedobacter sp.]